MGDDLRNDISSAFDASVDSGNSDGPVHETPPPVIAPEEAEPAQPTKPGPDTPVPPDGPGPEPTKPGEEHPAKREDGRDEKGRFAAKKVDSPVATQPVAPTSTATPPPAQATQSATEFRAPTSWKVGARERWAQLPPEVQSEVTRREREISTTLDQTAEARRFYGQFREAVGPFEGVLRAEGLEPLRAVQSLVQTYAGLRTAPIPHRAQLLAQLIKSSGVPYDVLDSTLAGEAPPPGQAQTFQDPRVDQLMAQLNQAAQQRQQVMQQRSASEVSKFGESREFFEDVRETMADLLEVAAKRGVELTLEDAYNAAIASPLHRDIAAAVKAREAASARGNAQASTARAKVAASSVRSQPAGAGPNGAPQRPLMPHEERRADLEAALAAVDGR